jgi:hypothetical protein
MFCGCMLEVGTIGRELVEVVANADVVFRGMLEEQAKEVIGKAKLGETRV